MKIKVTNDVIYWRGPSPYHFVEISDAQSKKIKLIANAITYGWGVIPATVKLDNTEWKTALFPKNGRYLIPIKDLIRKQTGVDLGDRVTVSVEIG